MSEGGTGEGGRVWEDTEDRRDKERSGGAGVREGGTRRRKETGADEGKMKGKGQEEWKKGEEKRREEEWGESPRAEVLSSGLRGSQ